jgi:hypothetical protein
LSFRNYILLTIFKVALAESRNLCFSCYSKKTRVPFHFGRARRPQRIRYLAPFRHFDPSDTLPEPPDDLIIITTITIVTNSTSTSTSTNSNHKNRAALGWQSYLYMFLWLCWDPTGTDPNVHTARELRGRPWYWSRKSSSLWLLSLPWFSYQSHWAALKGGWVELIDNHTSSCHLFLTLNLCPFAARLIHWFM